MASHCFLCLRALLMLSLSLATSALSSTLSPYYYDSVCPKALPTIKRVVEAAVQEDRRMGASLLRMHFHDCFVNGCDASVLLDQTSTIDSEKNAAPNLNSLRGYEVVDMIKWEVDRICGGPVVSCADILAVAARDSVVLLGGPTWKVRLGRRDSTTANQSRAEDDLPNAMKGVPELIKSFKKQGLNAKDLVALSGAHTIGLVSCRIFRDRIYNDTNIEPSFARLRRSTCPRSGGGDFNMAPIDAATPELFDNSYFTGLVKKKGLMISDQALFNGSEETDGLVKRYSRHAGAFSKRFAHSMIKMGNIKPLTGKRGQIRLHCRMVN